MPFEGQCCYNCSNREGLICHTPKILRKNKSVLASTIDFRTLLDIEGENQLRALGSRCPFWLGPDPDESNSDREAASEPEA
jgi:hypothetical protein